MAPGTGRIEVRTTEVLESLAKAEGIVDHEVIHALRDIVKAADASEDDDGMDADTLAFLLRDCGNVARAALATLED